MGERRGQGEEENGRMSISQDRGTGVGRRRVGGREGEGGAERKKKRERGKERGRKNPVSVPVYKVVGGCEWITKGREGEDAWQCACKEQRTYIDKQLI